MKLKMIAAALAIGLSAQAHAAIDRGDGGNGELFLSVWNANGSYTRDLNISINAFEAALAGSGAINLSFGADATFDSYLAGVDVSTLRFSVVAGDGQGARRILTTFTNAGATGNANDVIRTGALNISTHVGTVNTALAGADSVVVDSSAASYSGKTTFGDKINNKLNFSTSGSFASVLNFLRVDALAAGVAASINTPYADSGNAVKVWFDANNTLHIAAVPEPETYAMFLAGLGLMGAIARRRNAA